MTLAEFLALAKRIKDLTSIVAGWFDIPKNEKQEFFLALDRNNANPLLGKTYTVDVDTFFKNQLNDLGITTAERTALGMTLNDDHKGRPVYDTDLNLPFFWNGTAWQDWTVQPNSITNGLLAQMPPFTVMGNEFDTTQNAQYLPLQLTKRGKVFLIAGERTVTDTRITLTSKAFAFPTSNGFLTSVPILAEINNGNVRFFTGQLGDTAEFSYEIEY
jgi:hypothetical protein